MDLDNDNDLDMVSGRSNGAFYYNENAPNAPVDSTAPEDTMVCSGSGALLVASGIGNLTWYDALTGGNLLGSGASFNTGALTTMTSFFVQDSTVESGLSVARTEIQVGITQNSDANITANGITITATATGSYQWIDCDNGNQPLLGETNQSFIATVNGNYAVIVDETGCPSTSVCTLIDEVGLKSLQGAFVRISPNPAQSIVAISSDDLIQELTLSDANGKVLMTVQPMSVDFQMDLTSYERGVYLIIVQTETSGIQIGRVILE